MEEFVQMDYVRRIMAEIDERSQQRTAINNAEERGLKRGLKQGLSQGMSKGLSQGLAKGKAEVAKNLLEMGMSSETVSKATGLSAEEIAAL